MAAYPFAENMSSVKMKIKQNTKKIDLNRLEKKDICIA